MRVIEQLQKTIGTFNKMHKTELGWENFDAALENAEQTVREWLRRNVVAKGIVKSKDDEAGGAKEGK
ncbi:MAG TPA: hypothetical protein VKR59_07850 [Terriglobales bacterium]|nr:hypothetical protein [Terriglobales bacterium]